MTQKHILKLKIVFNKYEYSKQNFTPIKIYETISAEEIAFMKTLSKLVYKVVSYVPSNLIQRVIFDKIPEKLSFLVNSERKYIKASEIDNYIYRIFPEDVCDKNEMTMIFEDSGIVFHNNTPPKLLKFFEECKLYFPGVFMYELEEDHAF